MPQQDFRVKRGLVTGTQADITGNTTIGGNLSVTGTTSISNNVTITGNLTVTGTTTYINTATLAVSDNIVALNTDVTGAPTENAGIEINRGTSSNAQLIWNETLDVWQFSSNTTNHVEIHGGGVGGANVSIDGSNYDFLQDITLTIDKFGHVNTSTAAAANIAAALDGRYLGFRTITVGTANVVADTYSDTLTVTTTGGGIAIAANATTETINFDVKTSNTTTAGVVQLMDSVTNTSILHAATPNSVKTAYDTGVTANTRAYLCSLKTGDTFSGTVNVGANVNISLTGINIGNSTVNTTITATTIGGNSVAYLANTTVYGFANVTTSVNSAIITAGANVIMNTSGVYPASNTVGTALGSTTQRWNLVANTGAFSGAVSGITTLASGNTTITGFANVTSTFQVSGTSSYIGAASFSNTITVTGSATFANATSFTGPATFSNTMSVTGLITGTVTNANNLNGGTITNCTAMSMSGSAPTIWMYDTDHADFAMHVNSNLWYILNGSSSGIMYVDQSGNFTAVGDVTAYSDGRLKEEVTTIENALNIVDQMRGVMFTKDGKRGTGVIAQEIEQILPEVVRDNADGYKSVAYGNIVGVLIEAIKELKAEIEGLKGQLNGN